VSKIRIDCSFYFLVISQYMDMGYKLMQLSAVARALLFSLSAVRGTLEYILQCYQSSPIAMMMMMMMMGCWILVPGLTPEPDRKVDVYLMSNFENKYVINLCPRLKLFWAH
jgi:hypothetical protein